MNKISDEIIFGFKNKNGPYIFFMNNDEMYLGLSNGFNKHMGEIINIIIECKIKTIVYASWKDKIDCLNFKNNGIKQIIHSNQVMDINFNFLNHVQNFSNLPEDLEILNLSQSKFFFEKLNNLPQNLKKLLLPITYCHRLDNLPINLECILIRNSMCDLSYLPENVKILIMDFNEHCSYINLDNLPIGLEKLIINDTLFNGITLSNLPKKLKTLHLPKMMLKNLMDKNIHTLSHTGFNEPILNLPPNLEELKINLEYEFLEETLKLNTDSPIKIKKLIIGNDSSLDTKNIKTSEPFKLNPLIDSIEELEFGNEFNMKIEYLPQSLKKIKFGCDFNLKIDDVLPQNIEELEFGYKYNKSISSYPQNLKILRFGRNFSFDLKKLPKTLIELELGEKFQAMIQDLHEGLEILKFDRLSEFNDDLTLPNSLKKLVLGENYNKSLSNIPKSLEYIKFSSNNKKISELLTKSNYSGTSVNYLY